MLRLRQPLQLGPADYCLLTGAPRSGTTALINWLGNQRGIAAFQESRVLVAAHRFLQDTDRFSVLHANSATLIPLIRNVTLDYYSSIRSLMGKRLLVDKEPLEPIAFPSTEYGEFLVHVRLLFPLSKLLFVVRDPVATVWSMSRRAWGESLVDQQTRRFTLEEHTSNWCACAEIVLQYCLDSRSHVVSFERLMKDPLNESRQIADFLGLQNATAFVPQPTKEVGFDKEEEERILSVARPLLDRLRANGLSDESRL